MGPATRRFRVPPQTSITRAFDYSDEVGNVVEGRRRVYALQDRGLAERFASINSEMALTSEEEWTVAGSGGCRRGDCEVVTWRLLAG
jgi:hypothetical protein